MIPGDGMSPGVKIGPLVNAAAIERVDNQTVHSGEHECVIVKR